METYFDSAEGHRITKARALRELQRHGVSDAESVALFLAECGDRESYSAQAVLAWLGY